MSSSKRSNHLDVYQQYNSSKLIQEPRLAKVMSRWIVGILLLLILITFLPWTQNIRSNGQVTTFYPGDRPQTVHSTIAGRIEKWHVQEGEYIEKGDTIVALSEVKDKYFDPYFLTRLSEQIEAKEGALGATKQKATALQKQIKALQAGLQYSLSKAKNKVEQATLKMESDSIELIAAKTDYRIAKVQLERQEKLYRQGLKSLTEFESRTLKLQEASAKMQSAENKFYTAQNELHNARIELNSLEAEYQDKLSKAESEWSATLSYLHNVEAEISKMNNEYANMQIRSSFYAIHAPQDGYVIKALKSGLGETVKEGEAVASVMPANPQLAVALYVRPIDLPLLEKGRKVRLQFEGWPALAFSGWPNISFGTFGGVVAVIDNIDTDGKYRILVVPDPKDEPWPEAVRVGSGVYGWALLKDVPIWYEIWRKLNDFPADYVQESPTATEINDKEK